MNKKNEPIGQHYLPVSYLERFTDETSKVWMFDKKTEKLTHVHPLAIAKINYFYSYRDKNGERNYEIETMLGEIEGLTKPIIDKLEKKTNSDSRGEECSSLFYYFPLGAWSKLPKDG